ncbi:MAG: histidine phosphatase family protein [Desulfovibrionaceae bacterium]
MDLYLMQHGACVSGEIDPDQPLTPLGEETVARSARAMAVLGVRLDVMVSSPKTRAVQTAAIVARALHYPERDIVRTETAKAMARPEGTLEFLAQYMEMEAVGLFGHLPSLGLIASMLVASETRDMFWIENSGLTRIRIERLHPSPRGSIIWHLTPRLLGLIAEEKASGPLRR